jgi:branched-chain amino acid transport system substrate-binding protein
MKKRTLAALVTPSALALAGCGGDDKAGGTPSGPELTGDPIVIGAVGGYSGNQAGSQGLVDDASQVWADYTNANGGINGHPVKLIIKDDANDPAKALQAVKELVEEDHVIAIVGHSSLVSSTWIDYATKKNIPIIGGPPVESTSFTSPIVFPTGTNVPAMIVGQFVRMKEAGLSKMGVLYCAESPVCASLVPLAQASAALVSPDISIAYSAKISATQPSYSAECLAAKDAGVDAMFAGVQAPAVIALAEACNQVGFNPVDVTQLTVFSEASFASQPLDGSLLVSPTVNYLDESNPTAKAYLDAVDEFNPDMRKSAQFTVNTFWSWLGGEMFKKIAENADLGPDSTSADVFKGAYQIKDETLDGALAPTTYVEGKPTFVSCWFDVDLIDGGLKSMKAEPSCLTDEQLTGLNTILSGG